MRVRVLDKWTSFLSSFSIEDVDIYYSESYVKLYENADETALCLVVDEDDKVLLMPMLRRKITGFEALPDNYYDFETAYGYGGPIVNINDENWIHKALKAANQYFKEHNYLCGFIRFHPLLSNAKLCVDDMSVIADRETIVINTEMLEDEIWREQISSKNRNMIRKAEKNGLVYNAEYDFKSILQFESLYRATMERLNAEEFYCFDSDYFRSYIDKLRGHAFLGTVTKDKELICGALFMYSDSYGHYHLEGSNHQYSTLGANNLLLWKTACEMHRIGVKAFHLGGGYNADKENSLFKFKKAFSNETRQYSIGKMVFDSEAYERIRHDWARHNPEKVSEYGNRLLCYRY